MTWKLAIMNSYSKVLITLVADTDPTLCIHDRQDAWYFNRLEGRCVQDGVAALAALWHNTKLFCAGTSDRFEFDNVHCQVGLLYARNGFCVPTSWEEMPEAFDCSKMKIGEMTPLVVPMVGPTVIRGNTKTEKISSLSSVCYYCGPRCMGTCRNLGHVPPSR